MECANVIAVVGLGNQNETTDPWAPPVQNEPGDGAQVRRRVATQFPPPGSRSLQAGDYRIDTTMLTNLLEINLRRSGKEIN
jgi:hypothetical protein